MIQWAYPERWWWFWVIPALVGFWVWAFRHRRRALERFAHAALLPELTRRVDWASKRLKAGLLTAGITCLFLALVGPQWGFHWQEVTRRGVDLVIVLDVSKSMLAEDVKPNRLQRAKLAIQDLVTLLHGDRIGLVAFAGTGFLQCPLTTDYGAFLLTLDELGVESIPRGSTALARAIREGLTAFAASDSESRALIVISDGESHEGDALAAAREAAEAEVTIFSVGIGTTEGELIPIPDAQGQRSFLKDREGRTVKSRLDEAALKEVALATGGSYVRATTTAFGLDVIYRERIAKMEQHEFESTMRRQGELRYQWVLAVALLLLWVEPLLSDRKRAQA